MRVLLVIFLALGLCSLSAPVEARSNNQKHQVQKPKVVQKVVRTTKATIKKATATIKKVVSKKPKKKVVVSSKPKKKVVVSSKPKSKKKIVHKKTKPKVIAKVKLKVAPVAAVILPDRKPFLAAEVESPLVKTALQHIGTNPTGWARVWCGKFLDMVLQRAGHSPGSNLARAYASYGSPSPPRVGAIAVMPHHVGIVTEVGDGYVRLVSGNTKGKPGNRIVGISKYSMAKILTFRAPA